MLARTPPKENKMLRALNPVLVRETLNKVNQCMVRLLELEYTVNGGTKVVSGVTLSPRSTKGYLRTSMRCKQESARIKHDAPIRSPQGKFPRPKNAEGEEWRQMSLAAMLVGETVREILQASQFASDIVSALGKKTSTKGPKTPLCHRSNQKVDPENTPLNARRKKEKHTKPRSDTPPIQRASLSINFKVSPPKARGSDKENNRKFLANRGYHKSMPFTTTGPSPLFFSTHSSRQQQFCKTKSPVISRNMGTQQKFLIESPPSAASKFQVKVKNPPIVSISSSPTTLSLSKKSSPKRWVRPFSPSRVATRLASPLKSMKCVHKSDGVVSLKKTSSAMMSVASNLRRSFSPSRLATRFVSPLKSKRSAQQRGVKQQCQESNVQIPAPTI
ncbi:hypothetical protein Fmac_006976 [Flemingia macrophylla]|uniref:Microtubule-binding protein TANGLED n=1 Tax=Flemingia macrophylla TaxID=520843 RepID=A0ABD1NCM3_9FABA